MKAYFVSKGDFLSLQCESTSKVKLLASCMSSLEKRCDLVPNMPGTVCLFHNFQLWSLTLSFIYLCKWGELITTFKFQQLKWEQQKQLLCCLSSQKKQRNAGGKLSQGGLCLFVNTLLLNLGSAAYKGYKTECHPHSLSHRT